MKTRDRVYCIGAIISLIALSCNYSAFSVVLLIVGFSMVLVGYLK